MLEAEGTVVTSWLCTPKSLEALATGWLIGEGMVQSAREILEVVADPEGGRVRVRLDDRVARHPAWTNRHRPAVGSSEWSIADVPDGPSRMTPELRDLLAAPARLVGLFASMFDRASLREPGGVLHTGGRITEGALVDVAEDVGRSNVLDKLVGQAALAGVALEGSLFLLSGRISASLAAKGCRSGVAALASISIPTTLARDLARRSGLTLVGRSRSGAPQIHWA